MLLEFPFAKHDRWLPNRGLSNLNCIAQFITQSRFMRLSH